MQHTYYIVHWLVTLIVLSSEALTTRQLSACKHLLTDRQTSQVTALSTWWDCCSRLFTYHSHHPINQQHQHTVTLAITAKQPSCCWDSWSHYVWCTNNDHLDNKNSAMFAST